MKFFLIFYIAGLALTVCLVALKIIYPDLDNMFLTGLAGVFIVPLVKEAFARLRQADFLQVIKNRKQRSQPPEETPPEEANFKIDLDTL